MKPKSILAYSFSTIGFLAGCVAICDNREVDGDWPPPDLSPLSAERQAHYEGLARQWLSRVWTNDHAAYRAYVHLDKNDTSGTPYDRPPWEAPDVECYFRDERPEASNRLYSVVRFVNRDSDAVRTIRNSIYYDVPYDKHAPGIPKPNHVSERQARDRASEISAMFGVSNIWDATHFDTRCAGLIQGHWEFYLSHRINGYPTTHPLSVIIADLPGAPLYRWTSAIDWEGADIPTNVVLTAEQARLKGIEYMKKYFPLRDMVPELTYVTNSLEYVSPNYNYIRPAPGREGFSEYVSKKPELNLAYKCYFAKPDPDRRGVPPVIIYVDAVTGEMLGGAD